MLMLITYDVATSEEDGAKRLRNISKILKDYGQRVQFSVFECEVDPAQWVELRERLLAAMDPDCDSLRFYRLGSNWKSRIEHAGVKEPVDLNGPLII